MNIFTRITQLIRYTFQHIGRNLWQSIVVVIVLALTYYIALLIGLTGVISQKIIAYFEQQPQITVFFKNEALEEQILQAKKELENAYPIKEITYISKEQAVEIYKSQHQDDPQLLEFVTPDILPASLEISVKNVNVLKDIAEQFSSNQLVERVIYQEDLVAELTHWTATIRQIGIYVLGVIGFVSAVIIVLVVNNNFQKFGREIEIMRLVGAETWFIRIPFVIDGIIFSILGLIVSLTGIYFSIPVIEQFIREFLIGIPVLENQLTIVTEMGLVVGGTGTLMTILVSYLAMFKYVKK